jgi:hypothetical protein
MSTAAVTTSTPSLSLQQYFQQRQTDLKELGQDLQSGDLTDAQTEYNTIQSLAQNGPFQNGDAFYLSNRQSDFNTLGQALQSGNLNAAEQAFQQLKDTFEAPPPPTATGGSGGAAAAGTTTTPNNSTGGSEIVLNLANAPSGEQITINLNNSSNGTEQVSISASNPQSPQNPEQIAFNLNQNSNEQVVLNLFNNTASPTQAGGVNVSA